MLSLFLSMFSLPPRQPPAWPSRLLPPRQLSAGVGYDAENKEEGVPQPAASSPPAAGVGNDAENKEEAVPQPAASSVPAAAEEAVAEKVWV